MKKDYSKPVVTRVELKPVEATILGCKIESVAINAPIVAMGCAGLGCECRDVMGS